MGVGNVARYHTANSLGSSFVGSIACVAIQHWLGLLSKRWPGSGSHRSAGLGRYRTPLTLKTSAKIRTSARGGELLMRGIDLHEARSFLGNARGSGQTKHISGYGNYAVHAKIIVFDRDKVFMGSMNEGQRLEVKFLSYPA